MGLTKEELFQLVALAAQERFCPGAALLMEKEHGQELREHLEHCASCRSLLESPEDITGELALEKLANILNENILSQPCPEEVQPGQVWQLARSYGGWGAYACYYHAPQVLILDVLPYDVVRVAHISPFGSLKHQGDISLTEDSAGCFAEFWNAYSVPTAWLDVYVGRVRRGLVAAGHSLLYESQEQAGPEEGSPVDVFRQQELYHSMHFAMQAMNEVMELTEKWDEELRRQDIKRCLGDLAAKDCWSPVPPFSMHLPFIGVACCSVAAAATIAPALNFGEGCWSPVPEFPEHNAPYAVAAATATLTLNFGEGDDRNACHVEYDDGQLSYSIDYIPSHTAYAVVLLLDGIPVPVQDEQEEANMVIIDSDAMETRRCKLDEQSFSRCILRVFQNTSFPH